ncbi:MAG: (d)CMP kinase, partial [Planctomycetota bacterium]
MTREQEKPTPEHPADARVPPDRELIITIDGPAGTGKSTVARLLAKRLGLDFLDTGAMYRAAAAIAIDRRIDCADHEHLLSVLADADIHFDWSTDPPAVLAWFKPMNGRIRDADVTALVSTLAGIGRLREHMVRKQRLIGAQHPRLVTEGRDQGSVVFPDAPVKFYLDADPRVRAQRRAEQLRERDPDAMIEIDTLLADIQRRDHLDSSRADGPLRCPDDAERIDT